MKMEDSAMAWNLPFSYCQLAAVTLLRLEPAVTVAQLKADPRFHIEPTSFSLQLSSSQLSLLLSFSLLSFSLP
jgi:hypothetical protein